MFNVRWQVKLEEAMTARENPMIKEIQSDEKGEWTPELLQKVGLSVHSADQKQPAHICGRPCFQLWNLSSFSSVQRNL